MSSNRFAGTLALFWLPAAVALAAAFPTGSYTAHDLTIVFDNQGAFQVTQGGKTLVSGAYRVQGDQLELTDRSGPWACTKAGEQTGTYRWQNGDSGLTLTNIADTCAERAGTLATAGWKRKS